MVTYDLTELRDTRTARVNRIGHRLLGVSIAILLIALAGVFLLTFAARRSLGLPWAQFGLIIGLFGYILIMLFLIFRLTGEAPTALTIDESGFKFEYGGGRTWGLKWDDPRFSLRIFRRDMEAWGSHEPVTELVVAGPRPKNNYVTEQARDELLRLASLRGLDVVTGIPSRHGATMTLIAAPIAGTSG
jgi:hypothetical protein